jgi:hypothetical protein
MTDKATIEPVTIELATIEAGDPSARSDRRHDRPNLLRDRSTKSLSTRSSLKNMKRADLLKNRLRRRPTNRVVAVAAVVAAAVEDLKVSRVPKPVVPFAVMKFMVTSVRCAAMSHCMRMKSTNRTMISSRVPPMFLRRWRMKTKSAWIPVRHAREKTETRANVLAVVAVVAAVADVGVERAAAAKDAVLSLARQRIAHAAAKVLRHRHVRATGSTTLTLTKAMTIRTTTKCREPTRTSPRRWAAMMTPMTMTIWGTRSTGIAASRRGRRPCRSSSA